MAAKQTPPPNPANVRLAKSTAVRAHTLVIEWDEVPNVIGYKVSVALNSYMASWKVVPAPTGAPKAIADVTTGGGATINAAPASTAGDAAAAAGAADTLHTATSATVAGLLPGTQYLFRVAAVATDGATSSGSTSAPFTTLDLPAEIALLLQDLNKHEQTIAQMKAERVKLEKQLSDAEHSAQMLRKTRADDFRHMDMVSELQQAKAKQEERTREALTRCGVLEKNKRDLEAAKAAVEAEAASLRAQVAVGDAKAAELAAQLAEMTATVNRLATQVTVLEAAQAAAVAAASATPAPVPVIVPAPVEVKVATTTQAHALAETQLPSPDAATQTAPAAVTCDTGSQSVPEADTTQEKPIAIESHEAATSEETEEEAVQLSAVVAHAKAFGEIFLDWIRGSCKRQSCRRPTKKTITGTATPDTKQAEAGGHITQSEASDSAAPTSAALHEPTAVATADANPSGPTEPSASPSTVSA